MLEFLTVTWYLVEVFTGGGCVYGGVDMHACPNSYVKFVSHSLSAQGLGYAWKN